MVAAVQLCQPRARFSFTADCGSQPEAKTSPCLVVLRVDIALLPQRRLSLQFNPQIQLQNPFCEPVTVASYPVDDEFEDRSCVIVTCYMSRRIASDQ